MRSGIMYKPGDIVLTSLQFTDTLEIKIRPALILFEEFDNIIVAGITSNLNMEGVKITKKDGIVKDSVIKLNYIFTISKSMITKNLFHLNSEKKKLVYEELTKKLNLLNK